MNRGGERHSRPAEQNRFQQRRRNRCCLIHQDHFGFRPQSQQVTHRHKPQAATGSGGEYPRAGFGQFVPERLTGVAKEGLHILLRGRGNHDVLPALAQQFGCSHAHRRRFATAPVRRHYQRPAPSAQAKTDEALNQLFLIPGGGDSKAFLRQGWNRRP